MSNFLRLKMSIKKNYIDFYIKIQRFICHNFITYKKFSFIQEYI